MIENHSCLTEKYLLTYYVICPINFEDVQTREMTVPPQGLLVMPCQCSAGTEATWFVTAKGNYICSNCGRSR